MESNRKRRTMNDRRLLTRLPNVRSGGGHHYREPGLAVKPHTDRIQQTGFQIVAEGPGLRAAVTRDQPR